MSNFHSLEVVGRGSETQLQVRENLNYSINAVRVNPLTAKLFKLNFHPLEVVSR